MIKSILSPHSAAMSGEPVATGSTATFCAPITWLGAGSGDLGGVGSSECGI